MMTKKTLEERIDYLLELRRLISDRPVQVVISCHSEVRDKWQIRIIDDDGDVERDTTTDTIDEGLDVLLALLTGVLLKEKAILESRLEKLRRDLP